MDINLQKMLHAAESEEEVAQESVVAIEEQQLSGRSAWEHSQTTAPLVASRDWPHHSPGPESQNKVRGSQARS